MNTPITLKTNHDNVKLREYNGDAIPQSPNRRTRHQKPKRFMNNRKGFKIYVDGTHVFHKIVQYEYNKKKALRAISRPPWCHIYYLENLFGNMSRGNF